MMTHAPLTSPLGDVVAAMFDEAERYTTDAHEVRELATEALAHMLRQAIPASTRVSPRPRVRDFGHARRSFRDAVVV